MVEKRLDTGLILVTKHNGKKTALLMQRMEDEGTKDCSVTCFGMWRPDGKTPLAKGDPRFLNIISNANALFGHDVGEMVLRNIHNARLVVEDETETVHLQLYALELDVPKEAWPERTVPVTRETRIAVRQNNEEDLKVGPDTYFMAIHGKEALEKAFHLFAA